MTLRLGITALGMALGAGTAFAEGSASPPNYDTPTGYYSPAGQHQSAGPVPGNGAPTDPNAIAAALAAQANEATLPGETAGDYNIRKALVPTSLLPTDEQGVMPSVDPSDLTGKLGWDVKLNDAAVDAQSGYNASVATGSTLIGSYINYATSFSVNSQAAAQEIATAMKEEFSQASIFQVYGDQYARGARTLARDYEPGQTDANLSGQTNGSPTPNGSGSTGGSGNGNVQTIDGGSPLTSDQRQLLQGRGVDPDAFVSQIMSGNFSPQDLNRQLGAKTDFTPDEISAGKQIAYDSLSAAGLTPSAPGTDDAVSKGLASDTSATSFAQSRSALTSGKDESLALTERGSKRRVDSGTRKSATPTRSELLALMASLIKRKQEVQREGASIQYELLNVGVLPAHHGQNIFQVAHRNYRSFHKWRQVRKPVAAVSPGVGSPRVAQTAPPLR